MGEKLYRTFRNCGLIVAEPVRPLNAREWQRLFDAMRERQIPGLACGPEAQDQRIAVRFTDRQLKQAARLEHLRYLSLGGCRRLSDRGLAHLADLQRLEYLDLDLNRGHNRPDLKPAAVTDDGLTVLRGLTRLRQVHLWSLFGISDRAIVHLGDHTQLRQVSMQRTMAGDGAIEVLSGHVHMTGLSPGTQVTDAGLKHLRRWPRFREAGRRCQLLLLQSPRITDAGLETIAELDGLETLVLPEGAHFNNWVKRMPAKIAGTIRYTTTGIATLQRLQGLRKLWLTIKSDDMMEAIARIPNLQVVEGGAYRLSGTGYAALADSSIRSLGGWFCTGLTAEGLAALSSVPRLTYLRFDQLETQRNRSKSGKTLYRYRFSAKFRPLARTGD